MISRFIKIGKKLTISLITIFVFVTMVQTYFDKVEDLENRQGSLTQRLVFETRSIDRDREETIRLSRSLIRRSGRGQQLKTEDDAQRQKQIILEKSGRFKSGNQSLEFHDPWRKDVPSHDPRFYFRLRHGQRLLRLQIGEEYRENQLAVPKAGQFTPILLVTSWRSGSTFLGEILSRFPGAYYIFEPLVYFDKLSYTPSLEDKINHLSKMFNCNIPKGYLWMAADKKNKYIVFRNERMWNLCRKYLRHQSLCFSHEFVSRLCPQFPLRVAKVVRMGVKETEQMVKKWPTLKVIVLIRDPRAVMYSRKRSKFCNSWPCNDANATCRRMEEDISASYELGERYPRQIHLVRYEDLSIKPQKHVTAIFNFLNLTLTTRIKQYVDDHTTHVGRPHSLHSTEKISKLHVFKWLSYIPRWLFWSVQDVCRRPLHSLGYTWVNNLIEQRKQDNGNWSLLQKDDDDLWDYGLQEQDQSW